MDAVKHTVMQKVEAFILSNPHFKHACRECFERMDAHGAGWIRSGHALLASEYAFDDFQAKLREYEITLEQPTQEQLRELLASQHKNLDAPMNLPEYEEFSARMLELAASRFVTGFARKYAYGMLAGIAAVFVAKRVVYSTPIVGTLASPFLMFFPALLVGPVVGAVAMYGYEKGDVLAPFKKLLPKKKKPQFKSA